MKKKYNLLNSIAIAILVMILLTWIVPSITLSATGSASFDFSTVAPVGIAGVVSDFAIAIQYFYYTGLWLIVVAMFYAIIKKTGVYDNMVNNIISVFKTKKGLFHILTIILFAILSALITDTVALALFVPLFGSVLLGLGYNRIVTCASTVGAAIIGMIGKIYNSYIVSTLSIDFASSILPRFLILSLSLTIFTLILIRDKNSSSKEKITKSEGKKQSLKKDKKSIKAWPLYTILGIITIVFLLGMVPWETVFNTTVFTNLNTKFLGLKIFDYPLFGNIFGSFNPFGSFTTMDLMAILAMSGIILIIVYKLALTDMTKAIGDGIKKVMPIVITITVVEMVLILAINSGIYTSLTNLILIGAEEFSFILSSLAAMIQSVMLIEAPYVFNYGIGSLIAVFNDTSTYACIDAIYQSIYSLVSLFSPTSVLLVAGLYYFDVPYTKWVKYIWKILVLIFIVIIVIVLLMVLGVSNLIYWIILSLLVCLIIAYYIYKRVNKK